MHMIKTRKGQRESTGGGGGGMADVIPRTKARGDSTQGTKVRQIISHQKVGPKIRYYAD